MTLFSEWAALTQLFEGWSLEEIKGLSRRERLNWLEIAKSEVGRSTSG